MGKNHPNFCLLAAAGSLIVFGIVILASVSAPLSLQRFNNSYQYLRHQILFGVLIGCLAGFICYKIPLKFFKKYSYALLLVNIFLLVMVFLPHVSINVGGAKRWVGVGAFLFQPSEFLKITFLLYLATWLEQRVMVGIKEEEKDRRWKTRLDSVKTPKIKKHEATLLAFFAILGVLTYILISQPDMSTLLVIALTGIAMYFAARMPWSHLLCIALAGIGATLALIRMAPYRMERLTSFLKPETAPLGIGYQIHQALLAIGSGRIFGVSGGIGWGRQKFGFLPHPMTDSIFAIIGEETGFIGCASLIILILLFGWLGFKVARNAHNWFNKLLALGITCWLVLQSFFNIASMLSIFPIGGIPLPFISYGSSHLIAELIGVGLLLNISKITKS